MTKDEAIKIIEDACWWYWQGHCHGLTQAEIFEARDMAIKELSQEPICDRDCEHCTWTECPIEPCDDAISRDAVLKMAYDMSEIDGEHFTEPCMVVDVEDIQKLPPVTQKSGKWDASCTCSVCGQWKILESEKNGGKYKFCPSCGAKMESEV